MMSSMEATLRFWFGYRHPVLAMKIPLSGPFRRPQDEDGNCETGLQDPGKTVAHTCCKTAYRLMNAR
jgi:hypothetical protein